MSVNDPRPPGYRVYGPPRPPLFQRGERLNEYRLRVANEIQHYNRQRRQWRRTTRSSLRNAFPMRYPRRPLRGIYPDIPARAGIVNPDGSYQIPLSDRRNWRRVLGLGIRTRRRASVGAIHNLLERRNVGPLPPRHLWPPGIPVPLPGPIPHIPPDIRNHIASFL
jgi:hypothetical protein